jgi:hypothetical protein
MPISHINKLIFIHIPKTAGTSILSIEEHDFRTMDTRPTVGVDRNDHAFGTFAKNKYKEEWDNYFKFAVARNPWDRFVSSFEYSKMRKSYWHSDDKSTKYSLHDDYCFLEDKSFEEVVDLLCSDPTKFKHRG